MNKETSPTPAPHNARSYRFGVQEGKVVVAGKSRYPDFLSLEMPRADVVPFVMDLLRRVQNPMPGDTHVSVDLFGTMERGGRGA